MRASVQEQVGGAGASRVTAAFEMMNWGTVENQRHDLGTDLFVMARDERRYDLGLVVGVQVKTGKKYFRHPKRENNAVVGWWFRDDDRSHVDAWLSHVLPHLIVLHDLEANESYWAHVTPDAVHSTGKGAKILVLKENTLDAAHRDALLKVAATTRSGLALEGSIWTGASMLLPKDLLRHALVVPRLIAPHPNAGIDKPVTPQQAVALLMQGRLADYGYFAQKYPGVPSLGEACQSSEWAWRFVGALGHQLMTGNIDKFQALASEDKLGSPERVAATVVVASYLVEAGQVDEALALVEAELADDDDDDHEDAEPVDYAWLRLHHARACVEVGRADDAREDAAFVQRLRITHPDDITATAIAGVAAMIVFSTSPWSGRDVGAVVQGADTAAAWWRTQTVSVALSSFADRTFEQWGDDTTVHLGDDPANDQLLTAALTANYLGDHPTWCHLHALLGRDKLVRLDRNSDPAKARDGLEQLRLAGDEKALTLAVHRLAADGPAMAITLAASEIELERSTRTTGRTNLALLQHGGDLLDAATAERTVGWLLATLTNPPTFTSRTSPTYDVVSQLIDTLAGVTSAAPPDAREAIVQYLIALPAQPNQVVATAWTRVARALPPDSWDEGTIRLLAARSTNDYPTLRTAIQGLAALYDPAVRADLLAQAKAGSLEVIGELGDVRDLPHDVVTRLVALLSERVDQQVTAAHSGHYGFGGLDCGGALALLNLWHPDHADWGPILALLSDPAVAVDHKNGAMQALAGQPDRIPVAIRARLAPIAQSAAQAPPSAMRLFFDLNQSVGGAAAHLAVVLGAFDAEATSDRLLTLLTGTHDDRLWAVAIASRARQPEHLGLLVRLCQDPDPDLRANAAASLASVVAAGDGGSLATAGLRHCLIDPGTTVPYLVTKALIQAPSLAPVAENALIALRDHLSARVRTMSSYYVPKN